MGHSIEVGPIGLTDQDETCRPRCRATAWGATSPVPPAVPSGAMGGTVALSVQPFAFPHSGRCEPSLRAHSNRMTYRRDPQSHNCASLIVLVRHPLNALVQ